MNAPPPSIVPSLNDETKLQFGGLMILDRMIQTNFSIHAGLLEKNEQLLEPYINELESHGFIETNDQQYYTLSEKGRELYQKLIDQQASYHTHFEIYAYVDLEQGCFANPEFDFLDDERWSDLRVTVALFKGVDPYRLVFLTLLSEEHFFESNDWPFDLAMGSFFDELEEIIQTQVHEDELGYGDDNQEWVSGHDVLQDIIEQGSQLNKERHEQRKAQEAAVVTRPEPRYDEGDDDIMIMDQGHPSYGYGYSYYDPFLTLGAYAGSALFIEALWHDPYW